MIAKFIPTQIIFSVLVAATAAWYFFGGGMEMQIAYHAQKLVRDEIAHAEMQYAFAKRNGTLVAVCIYAESISVVYDQAHDEQNYQKWKAVEKVDCKSAGMPQ